MSASVRAASCILFAPPAAPAAEDAPACAVLLPAAADAPSGEGSIGFLSPRTIPSFDLEEEIAIRAERGATGVGLAVGEDRSTSLPARALKGTAGAALAAGAPGRVCFGDLEIIE